MNFPNRPIVTCEFNKCPHEESAYCVNAIAVPVEPKKKFDAKFHAFQKLSKLLDVLLPQGAQLTTEQADAVHATATALAKDLTGGDYVYTPR